MIDRITDSILDPVFFGASRAIANRRNSRASRPYFILLAATGDDQIATAYRSPSNLAPKQIECLFLTTFDQSIIGSLLCHNAFNLHAVCTSIISMSNWSGEVGIAPPSAIWKDSRSAIELSPQIIVSSVQLPLSTAQMTKSRSLHRPRREFCE